MFDLFNLDGILGDKFLVNGKIQPFFNVQPRRYRFRLLDTGPSRFYEFFLTNLNNWAPRTVLPDRHGRQPHTASDPDPERAYRAGGARGCHHRLQEVRGQTLYLENRLNQLNGQGPAAVDSQVAAQNSATTECSGC